MCCETDVTVSETLGQCMKKKIVLIYLLSGNYLNATKQKLNFKYQRAISNLHLKTDHLPNK